MWFTANFRLVSSFTTSMPRLMAALVRKSDPIPPNAPSFASVSCNAISASSITGGSIIFVERHDSESLTVRLFRSGYHALCMIDFVGCRRIGPVQKLDLLWVDQRFTVETEPRSTSRCLRSPGIRHLLRQFGRCPLRGVRNSRALT
jgi:hypothetical protein